MELLDHMHGPPPELDDLFLLGTQDPLTRLEEIIALTDQFTQPFIQAMTAWYVTARSGPLVISLTELPELAQQQGEEWAIQASSLGFPYLCVEFCALQSQYREIFPTWNKTHRSLSKSHQVSLCVMAGDWYALGLRDTPGTQRLHLGTLSRDIEVGGGYRRCIILSRGRHMQYIPPTFGK